MVGKIIATVLYIVITIIIIALLFWKLWFLRDPERATPQDKNLIISPADGRINEIVKSSVPVKEIRKGKLGKIDVLASDVAKDYVVVSIMMTPMDVHIQRAPIKGIVKYSKHTPGKFANAMQDGIAINNEKNEILFEGDNYNVKIVQIAGALARRIKSFVRKGQDVEKGERVGLINLGSQVSVIMPADVELKVKLGQRVTSGETVIATK